MKKISIVLVILIIFNFICPCFFSVNVYASPDPVTPDGSTGSDNGSSSSSSGSFSMDEYKSIADEGKSTINGNTQEIKLGDSDVGSASSQLGSFFVNIAAVVAKIFANVTNEGGFYYTESEYSAEKTGIFTVNSLIFGEYLVFNSKAYQKSTDLNNNITPSGITKAIDSIKEAGASLSQLFLKIGLALALPFTILAIIRAVSAQRASDLAAWKKILVRWILCLFFIIFYQYILAIIDTAADYLIDTFWKIRVNLETAGYKAFETTVEEEITRQYTNSGGVTSLAYAIIFVVMIIIQAMFVIKYAVRALGTIFLFVIAPVVIVIHSFNLMIGKESDMLGDFFKDYFLLVFMQPLHALFYIVFFFSLSEIAINVPILGILLLFALLRAIDIAKAMFGWELGSSLFKRS